MIVNFNNFDELIAPKQFSDIVFRAEYAKETVANCISGNWGFPGGGKSGIVLYGDTGTGKTALANLIPKWIEFNKTGDANPLVDSFDITSVDGPEQLAIVRKRLEVMPLFSYHYVVLNEVHELGSGTAAALKATLDAGKGRAVFVLTTNNLGKLDKAAINRCHVVDFNAAPAIAWLPLVRRVLNYYQVPGISDATLLPLIESCKGSGRNVLDMAKRLVQMYYLPLSAPVPVSQLANSAVTNTADSYVIEAAEI